MLVYIGCHFKRTIGQSVRGGSENIYSVIVVEERELECVSEKVLIVSYFQILLIGIVGRLSVYLIQDSTFSFGHKKLTSEWLPACDVGSRDKKIISAQQNENYRVVRNITRA